MGRVLLGYVFFLFVGSLFGYVLAVAYINTQLQQPVGLFYPLLNAQSFAGALPEVFETAVVILGVCAFAGLAVGVYLVSERLTIFGTPHWLTHQELRQGKFFNKPSLGFLVAKTSKPNRKAKFISSEKFPHCLVIAPTGRGKGTGFVIPNLLTTKGSAVVLDVKGENFEKTARHRKSIGDKIIRFAPTDFKGSSHRYNPLLRIYALENESEQMFELQKLATLFLQSDNSANEGLLRGGMDAFVAGVLTAFERNFTTVSSGLDLSIAIYGLPLPNNRDEPLQRGRLRPMGADVRQPKLCVMLR
ncbi:type IV secretory system conjugative DNA transfer family protein [Falsihalocynthiibacter sp. CO-5D18]|uniref:type IV secretory system conjugative DNA transfer family protein n=1 Tax=Falsihalocynthiibacter sp. CO-5D18 TaxID=3240872 RepID=UPI0035107124